MDDQSLEDAKICGGPWIVGGVMRHEHHRDQSCWFDWSNLYESKEILRAKKKKVKVSDGKLCPTPLGTQHIR